MNVKFFVTHNIIASRLVIKNGGKPLRTKSSKKSARKSDFGSKRRKSHGCDCDSASEMCSRSTSARVTGDSQSSRSCSGRGLKSCAK